MYRAFKNYAWIFGIAALVPLVLLATLGVRGQRNGNRPIHFFFDMKYQPRYGPQGQSDYFADGRSMRPVLPGVVPFAGGGYFPDAGQLRPDDVFAATGLPKNVREGVTLSEYFNGYKSKADPKKMADGKLPDPRDNANEYEWVENMPVVMDRALIRRGQEVYQINCKLCHGEIGDGKGIIAHYGEPYGVKPASYHQERLRSKTADDNQDWKDGHLFNVITNGKATMAPYGHQVKVADRWALVAYIRVLQRASLATLAEVPESQRGALEKK